MFQPTSNKSVSILKTDNSRYIIQFYSPLPDTPNMPVGTMPRMEMKSFVAVDITEAVAIITNVLETL